jgi:hypothetical protein
MKVAEEYVPRKEYEEFKKMVIGNGQPGMKQTLESVSDDVAAMRGAQDERAKIDKRRWTVQALILSALSVLLAGLTFLVATYQMRHW